MLRLAFVVSVVALTVGCEGERRRQRYAEAGSTFAARVDEYIPKDIDLIMPKKVEPIIPLVGRTYIPDEPQAIVPKRVRAPAQENGETTKPRKLLVIDVDKRNLHELQCDLPSDLAAGKPEDVGFVVLVREVLEEEGQLTCHEHQIPSYRVRWDVAIVEQSTGNVVVQTLFHGADLTCSPMYFMIGENGVIYASTNSLGVNKQPTSGEPIFAASGGIPLTSGERLVGIKGAPPRTEEVIVWLTAEFSSAAK